METSYKDLLDSIPDVVEVGPVTILKGTLDASPSKSYTHRAIMVGGLGQNSVVENPLVCADTIATCRLWRHMGAEIDYDNKKNALRIKGIDGTINLILVVSSPTAGLEAFIASLDRSLTQSLKELPLPILATYDSVLNAILITKKDLELGKGHAALVTSIFTPPLKVWQRL